MTGTAGVVAELSPYTFKRSAYSSHSLLLEHVDAQPERTRVLERFHR